MEEKVYLETAGVKVTSSKVVIRGTTIFVKHICGLVNNSDPSSNLFYIKDAAGGNTQVDCSGRSERDRAIAAISNAVANM